MVILIPGMTIAADTGLKSPSLSVAGGQFTNPDNAFSSNDSYATVSTNGYSQQYANFGLTIPNGSTINGTEVIVEAKSNSTTGVRKFNVALSWNGGTNFTSVISTGNYGTNDVIIPVGGSTNTWGRTWSISDFSNTNFRVKLTADLGVGRNLSLDHIQVRIFYTDTEPPTDPTAITSTSHTVMIWSNDNTVDVQWSGATDNVAVAGYSILWDTNPNTVPDTSIDVLHTTDPHSTTSPSLATGNTHYFHLRTCDTSGNCTSTVHLGPFYIDTTAPTTSASPAGGTYFSAQDVTLTCSDDSGSGCASTLYCLGVGCSPETTYSFGETIPISSSDTLRFYSTDNASNSESEKFEEYLILNTPTGSNVTGDLGGGVRVTFEQVTRAGMTSMVEVSCGSPPAGYRFDSRCYDITTTATYTGSVTVTIPYNESSIQRPEENLRLFHWESGSWHDVTFSIDTGNNTITGQVTSLSPFGIGESMYAYSTGANTHMIAVLALIAISTGVFLTKKNRRNQTI